jgi:hypothetical protein
VHTSCNVWNVRETDQLMRNTSASYKYSRIFPTCDVPMKKVVDSNELRVFSSLESSAVSEQRTDLKSINGYGQWDNNCSIRQQSIENAFLLINFQAQVHMFL